ncbi:DUF1173 family protein [Mesorhizobium sp. M0152]|uniref:DUF1173 family protein n=1 Tax=Mesorhizobium sp. M0152 TaxID=2956898 RepID=UPI003336F1B0
MQMPSGILAIDEIGFMNVTENWIPFQHNDEKELIEVLTGEHRRFVKTLRQRAAGGADGVRPSDRR